jgi:hypothetical protein
MLDKELIEELQLQERNKLLTWIEDLYDEGENDVSDSHV